MTKISIKIKQDIRNDAWNWWDACNTICFGVDWKQRVSKKLWSQITGKTHKAALTFLLPILKSKYQNLNISARKNKIQKAFDQSQSEIFAKMEKITGKKIYRNDFTIFLTTFPRAPYNCWRGRIWAPVDSPKRMFDTFIHELLHFQTLAYWQKKCLKTLTKEQFEDLKESLTVILNDDFKDLMTGPDRGYPTHKNLRKKLFAFWKKNKDFNKLIKHGLKIAYE